MDSKPWLQSAGCFLAAAMLLTSPARVAADDDRPKEDSQERTYKKQDISFFVGSEFDPGYRLSISVTRVPRALDTQLGLAGKGILVSSVHDGGPADEAGIEPHDILIRANAVELADPGDLRIVTEKSDGEAIRLTVVRRGEKKDVSVTPSKSKPTKEETEIVEIAPFGQIRVDVSELRDVETKILEKLKDAGIDLRMQLIEPGRYLPKGLNFAFGNLATIPDDVTIKIEKTGSEPANIEVVQGDKSWKVKEDKLDPLPEELRKHVESFLGRGPMRFNVIARDLESSTAIGPKPPRPPRPKGSHSRVDELDRAFDQLNERMGDLRKELDGVRRQLRDELRERRRLIIREEADEDVRGETGEEQEEDERGNDEEEVEDDESRESGNDDR